MTKDAVEVAAAEVAEVEEAAVDTDEAAVEVQLDQQHHQKKWERYQGPSNQLT
jgi:hypothetical protein